MSLPELVLIITAALVCTTVGFYFISRQNYIAPVDVHSGKDVEISLLFKGDKLQHATESAHKIANFNDETNDWLVLRESLSSRFPDFPKKPVNLTNTLILRAQEDTDIANLEIRQIDDSTHVQIIDCETLSLDVQHKIRNLEAEVRSTELAGSTAPHPIWQVDILGNVCWFNEAYETLHNQVHDDDPDMEEVLFDTSKQSSNPLGSTRISIKTIANEKLRWFDISSVKIDTGTMFHAIDINAVINAEIAQRNFVQTLAKTFAQLSTGLAIFDRNGQLALFNPALVDLTSLPAEFLSARPDLLSFFDRLRDNRVMPEPKNYHSWRQEISEVIAAATDGRYQETWTLGTGQTYRVSGRPHPDGAIAFLIEDISAEVSLAQNFRSDLEIGQSLIDTFDTGLIVFSSAGVLQTCNAAYREIWNLEPETTFADVTILDSIKDWQNRCLPNPAWGDIRDFVMKVGDRAQWDCRITSITGAEFECVIKPIALGATAIRFVPVSQKAQQEPEKQLALYG